MDSLPGSDMAALHISDAFADICSPLKFRSTQKDSATNFKLAKLQCTVCIPKQSDFLDLNSTQILPHV